MSRDVAQPGSAFAWGAKGREFKSRHPDQSKSNKTPNSLQVQQNLTTIYAT